MQIQSGIVKYKDRTDLMCTYGITDEGKQYYFMAKPLTNGNIIVTTELVEAIDPLVKISHVGLINSDGRVVIPLENKAIKVIEDQILLVERAEPISESVKTALNSKNDPLEAARLVTNSANIKEKINAVMGVNGRYVYNDQFSEASIFDFDGNNLVDGEYYSFIGVNNNKVYLNKNTVEGEVREYSLLKTNFQAEENTSQMAMPAVETTNDSFEKMEDANKEEDMSNENTDSLINNDNQSIENEKLDTNENTDLMEKSNDEDKAAKVDDTLNLEENTVNDDLSGTLEMPNTLANSLEKDQDDLDKDENESESDKSENNDTSEESEKNTISAEEVKNTVESNDLVDDSKDISDTQNNDLIAGSQDASAVQNNKEEEFSDLVSTKDTEEEDKNIDNNKSDEDNVNFNTHMLENNLDENDEDEDLKFSNHKIEGDSGINFMDTDIENDDIFEDSYDNYDDDSFSVDFDSDKEKSIIDEAARYVAKFAKINKEQTEKLASATEAYRILKEKSERKFDSYSNEINELKKRLQNYEETIAKQNDLLKQQKEIISRQKKENSYYRQQLKGTAKLRAAMEEATRFLNDDDDDVRRKIA